MTDPKSMLDSMGIDINDIENHFNDSLMQTADQKVPLKFINETEHKDPSYEYISDSGFDLIASEEIWIQAHDRKLIPTGLRFDIPLGYEIQVRSKSGLAINQGLMVLNSPGTIDQGYTGEIQVIVFNTTKENVKIKKGQKIAQGVLCPVVSGKWIRMKQTEKIKEKDRNDNGFGSTGVWLQ